MDTQVARRTVLAAIPAAALLAAAGKASAASPAVPQRVTLQPGEKRTLIFPLTSAGYVMQAAVRTSASTPYPYVIATVTWPDGSSQRWVLGSSAYPAGQRYSGSGPASGSMKVVLQGAWLGDQAFAVAMSVAPTMASYAGHAWMAETNRPVFVYPLAHAELKAGGMRLHAESGLAQGSLGLRYVPLYPGQAEIRAERLSGMPGKVYLSSLDPDVTGSYFAAEIPAGGLRAKVTLPGAPSLLSVWDGGSGHGRYSVRIAA